MATQAKAISEKEHAIIAAIYTTYRYVMVDHITRLFFSRTSKNYAGAYLKRLADANLLERFALPATRRGNTQFVYTVSWKGFTYLKSLDLASYGFVRPPTQLSYFHIAHSLCLTEVLVTAALLSRDEPRVTLHTVTPDWVLKHCAPTIHDGSGSFSVVPDALLEFRAEIAGKMRRRIILLEVDRGTEAVSQIKQKVRHLLLALESPSYHKLFGTNNVVVAFATTAGEKRVSQMRAWIAEELTATQRIDDTWAFLCTALPSGEVSSDVFLKHLWQMLDSDELVALLPL